MLKGIFSYGDIRSNTEVSKEVYLDATDYVALKALYESTGGTEWKNRRGWNFSSDTPPLAEDVHKWHGVLLS